MSSYNGQQASTKSNQVLPKTENRVLVSNFFLRSQKIIFFLTIYVQNFYVIFIVQNKCVITETLRSKILYLIYIDFPFLYETT